MHHEHHGNCCPAHEEPEHHGHEHVHRPLGHVCFVGCQHMEYPLVSDEQRLLARIAQAEDDDEDDEEFGPDGKRLKKRHTKTRRLGGVSLAVAAA